MTIPPYLCRKPFVALLPLEKRYIVDHDQNHLKTHLHHPRIAVCWAEGRSEINDIMNQQELQQAAIPKLYLVICNISKKANVKALLLTAAAFGCQGILVVGQKKFDMDPQNQQQQHDLPKKLLHHIQSGQLPIHRFDKWEDCIHFLQERSIFLIGVEIHPEAQTIDDFLNQSNKNSRKDMAFVMGNEGQGLHPKQMKSCQAFVRIPQYGAGTASLNVYTAASIILHRVHEWKRTHEEHVKEVSASELSVAEERKELK